MKRIVNVELVFDTSDAVNFTQDDIGKFEISNLQRKIKRFSSDKIADGHIAKEVHIQINPRANVKASYTYEKTKTKDLPFKRLTEFGDIIQVAVMYDDQTMSEFHIEWVEGSQYVNPNQTSRINKHTGDLYLSISDSTTVLQYFKEDVNSEEAHPIWGDIVKLDEIEGEEIE